MQGSVERHFARVRGYLPRVASPAAYAAALLLIAGATLIRLPLDAWAGEPLPPFITFSPMIVLSGVLGGIRAGLLACAASIAVAWFVIIGPPEVSRFSSRSEFLTVAVYTVTGSLMAFISGSARVLYERVSASERERSRAASESVHRIKNLIAVTQALSRQAAKRADTVSGYKEELEKRLAALGAAQNMLIGGTGRAAPLSFLIDTALAPFPSGAALIVQHGPDADVPPSVVNGLTLALYELATNALKYGALSDPEGEVRLSWKIDDGRCVLTWVERAGAALKLSGGSGFGTALIRSALAAEPGARVSYDVTGEGVVCMFDWPVTAARPVAGKAA